MPPDLVEAIAPLVAMLSLGGLILAGMKLRYDHIRRLKQGGSSPEEVERLTEVVNALRDDVRLMREEMLSINDRVEFTERLLEQPKTPQSRSDTQRSS